MNKSRIIKNFSVPLEEADLPHFELNGSAQLIADGCVGILHYDECRVCLNCGREVIEVEGEKLTLNHLGESEAEVKGKICSVKFV